MVDIERATEFLTTHGRLLDRRRLGLLLGDGVPAEGVLAALAAYRNADGGFGWGLEPDLRSAGSQPAGALHAFEVFEECAPRTTPLAAELCDWLAAVSLPDGGLPFALAAAGGAGTAPWWAGADPETASLHITAAVCGAAHRVAAHDPAVASHAWLARATDCCLRAAGEREEPGGAYELMFVLHFLDAIGASAELERWARFVPASGVRPVDGGVAGEALKPLDLAPRPDRPLRDHLDAGVIERDLDRVEAGQREDGGWDVDFAASSPAGALEWRGYATVDAIGLLRANGRPSS